MNRWMDAISGILRHEKANSLCILCFGQIWTKISIKIYIEKKKGLVIINGVHQFYDYLHAWKFSLITDHKPLYYIFEEKKGIPIYAALKIGLHTNYDWYQ